MRNTCLWENRPALHGGQSRNCSWGRDHFCLSKGELDGNRRDSGSPLSPPFKRKIQLIMVHDLQAPGENSTVSSGSFWRSRRAALGQRIFSILQANDW